MVFKCKAKLAARFVRSAVVVGACPVLSGIVSVPSENVANGAQEGAQEKVVDFRNPPREYEKVTLTDAKYGNVRVFVEKQLKDEDPSIVKKAVTRLKKKRAKVLSLASQSRTETAGEGSFLSHVREQSKEWRQGQWARICFSARSRFPQRARPGMETRDRDLFCQELRGDL